MEKFNIIILNITPYEHPKYDQIETIDRKHMKLLTHSRLRLFFLGKQNEPVLKKNCDFLDVPNEYFDPSCIESRVIKPY